MSREGKLAEIAFRVVCLGFSALLLVLTLLTHIQLVRAQTRIRTLGQDIARAENEHIALEIRSIEALNLAELERRATQELGMRRPEPGQIQEIEYLG